MGRRSDIPWGEIKTEYVTTDTSYRQLAKKYGGKYRLSDTTIAKRGSAEDWVSERERYRSEKAAKIEEARTRESIEQGLAAIREIGNVATASIETIRKQIAGAGNGTQAEAAVGALRGLLLIIRDCYGILTATEQAKIDNDKERLALEKAKAERKDPAENADRIIIGSEVYGV